MLAVKAAYDNGTVRWLQKPPDSGVHSLIVIFEDIEDSEQTQQVAVTEQKTHAMERLQALCEDLPPDLSMVDMLLEDRRKEAKRE